MLTPPGGRCIFVSVCEFWKGYPNFIFVFNGNDTSIIHCFQYHQVLWWSGNDVIVFSLLGSAAGEVWMHSMQSDHDFMLVFNNNHTFILHRFRCSQVLQFAGNDVIVLSPLGGAASDFSLQILKGRPWLYCCVDFCVYLEPFRRYSMLFIWLGFQHL